ncbi:MAG: ammonium transporter [Chloroflexi bacterium]|nr:ammonium transporter [Chloroflexota bacterium]
MDTGSIAWMLTATLLVLFMTPGLAFFYGGLVRGRNVVSTLMYSFIAMGVASIVWVLWGYSLAFNDTGNGIVGGLEFIGLSGVSMDEGDGIPDLLFAAFQMTFAIITPALITGAFVERFKFTTYLIFLVLWVTLVYAPVCHWVWGGGWIGNLDGGALDFAGGTVVHINAGIAAVAAAILVGKRRRPGLEPHNVPFVVLGAAILWIGWFGFNAGSQLAADGVAVQAFVNTNTAAAVAAVAWALLSYIHTGRISAVGVATGVVAGLVAVTPAAGWVGTMGSFAIGLGAGIICHYAVHFEILHKLGVDDSLEVFAVHGLGGIWGALATGIFAWGVLTDSDGGLVNGNAGHFVANVIAVVATLVYSGVVSFIILFVLDKIPGLGLRITEPDEDIGIDITAHGERGYVADGAD